jgi:hypothetical protein
LNVSRVYLKKINIKIDHLYDRLKKKKNIVRANVKTGERKIVPLMVAT